MGFLLANLVSLVGVFMKLVKAVRDRPGGKAVSVRKVRKRARELVDLADDAVVKEMLSNGKPEDTALRRQLVQVMVKDGYPEILSQMAVHEAAADAFRKAKKRT